MEKSPIYGFNIRSEFGKVDSSKFPGNMKNKYYSGYSYDSHLFCPVAKFKSGEYPIISQLHTSSSQGMSTTYYFYHLTNMIDDTILSIDTIFMLMLTNYKTYINHQGRDSGRWAIYSEIEELISEYIQNHPEMNLSLYGLDDFARKCINLKTIDTLLLLYFKSKQDNNEYCDILEL
jgi:hypothetical protein